MYGVTVNHVTGLKVVLPSGEVVQFGGKAAECSGYDLTGFFVGSEGTVGIVTEVTVKLLRTAGACRHAAGDFRVDRRRRTHGGCDNGCGHNSGGAGDARWLDPASGRGGVSCGVSAGCGRGVAHRTRGTGGTGRGAGGGGEGSLRAAEGSRSAAGEKRDRTRSPVEGPQERIRSAGTTGALVLFAGRRGASDTDSRRCCSSSAR